MVPAARRFSTPNPLSFPMMSRRMYLGEEAVLGWHGEGRGKRSLVWWDQQEAGPGCGSCIGRDVGQGLGLSPQDSRAHLDSPPSSTCSQCTEFMALILV